MGSVCASNRRSESQTLIKTKIETRTERYKVTTRLSIDLPGCEQLAIWSSAPVRVICGMHNELMISDVEDIETLLVGDEKNKKKYITIPASPSITIVGNADIELLITSRF